MNNKDNINEFCNEISQMAEDRGFTSWDFYLALQEMCTIVSSFMRNNWDGEGLSALGNEKWEVEYGRIE